MFWDTRSVEEMAGEFAELEAEISVLRNRQAVLVGDLDRVNAAGLSGSRSMVEWVSSRFDVAASTATDVVFAARWFTRHRRFQFRLVDGEVTFDRAVASVRLAVAGGDESTLEASARMDLVGVGRLTARQRHVTRRDEYRVFDERFVAIQPTLDESSWRLSGRLPSVEGRIVGKALCDRADGFGALPGAERGTRAQRQADGLVAMAQDSLDGHTGGHDGEKTHHRSGSSVTVFIDLDQADGTGAETGAAIEYGPRVGPAAIERLLCTGSIQIVGVAGGRAVVASDASRAIPPATRRLVAYRDGRCVINGCRSRHRLEPHHVRRWSHGGSHDPNNLATLCWYHHHIAIHNQGFTIDPDTPPHRRRLIRTPVDAERQQATDHRRQPDRYGARTTDY